MPTENPPTRHSNPPYPQPKQEPPGREREMYAKDDHAEKSYKGNNKLKGGEVLRVTGGRPLS